MECRRVCRTQGVCRTFGIFHRAAYRQLPWIEFGWKGIHRDLVYRKGRYHLDDSGQYSHPAVHRSGGGPHLLWHNYRPGKDWVLQRRRSPHREERQPRIDRVELRRCHFRQECGSDATDGCGWVSPFGNLYPCQRRAGDRRTGDSHCQGLQSTANSARPDRRGWREDMDLGRPKFLWLRRLRGRPRPRVVCRQCRDYGHVYSVYAHHQSPDGWVHRQHDARYRRQFLCRSHRSHRHLHVRLRRHRAQLVGRQA